MNVHEAHETHEKIEHAGHHGSGNKKIAVLIVILAAFLSVCEAGGKNAQNSYTASNIEAANLWNYYQAKVIRSTTLRTAAELLEHQIPANASAANSGSIAKTIEEWRDTADGYESDPEKGRGTKELYQRAKVVESARDEHLAAYHLFEFGAAAFELGIVLASASVLTGTLWLVGLAFGLGGVGAVLSGLGWFAPLLLHW